MIKRQTPSGTVETEELFGILRKVETALCLIREVRRRRSGFCRCSMKLSLVGGIIVCCNL
jgi:hypothetical protein